MQTPDFILYSYLVTFGLIAWLVFDTWRGAKRVENQLRRTDDQS